MKITDIRQYIAYVMQGTSSIDQRKALLQAHRQAILAKQAAIAKNLQEIDLKLNMYASPAAEALVGQELAVAQAEKIANDLPNPFQVAIHGSENH